MSKIVHISENDFLSNTLRYDKIAIVECIDSGMAGVMQIMKPIFDKLENKFKNDVKHLRVFTDEHPKIAEQFYIVREPSYLLFFNGRLLERFDYMLPFNELSNILERYVKQIKSE